MKATHILAATTPVLALLVTAPHGGRNTIGASRANVEIRATVQQPAPPAVRYDRHIFAGGSPPPAGTLQNAFKGDSSAAADGAKLFGAFNCDGCHAGGAVGAVGPSLADGRWRYGGNDGEIFSSIYFGRPYGMPAFGGILPPDAIWKLVTYLQSLQPKQDNPTVSW